MSHSETQRDLALRLTCKDGGGLTTDILATPTPILRLRCPHCHSSAPYNRRETFRKGRDIIRVFACTLCAGTISFHYTTKDY